jgi:hypothetical protein
VQIRNTGGVAINSGGTGYTVGDVLTVSGGTGTAATLTVATVSAGVITAITLLGSGGYSVLPTFPASVTGGTGSGATFTFVDMALSSGAVTITNAGSGYVEQPTVTFSGGGGSGAAAIATVGSTTTLKTLAFVQNFDTSGGTQFQIQTTTGNNAYPVATGGINGAAFFVAGAATNAGLLLATKGTSAHDFYTNGFAQLQMRVAHTASAVNYVQVTGNIVGNRPSISAQGSDSSIGLDVQGKGTVGFVNLDSQRANYIRVQGSSSTGGVATFSTQGSDTNIDLALTPKGTGNVRFGTYTGTVLTPTGFIEIKDSSGTIRRLLVG